MYLEELCQLFYTCQRPGAPFTRALYLHTPLTRPGPSTCMGPHLFLINKGSDSTTTNITSGITRDLVVARQFDLVDITQIVS